MAGQSSGLLLLLAYWLGYFALHSLLASLAVKSAVARRWPAAFPAYRLVYNGVAVLLVLPPLVYVMRYPGPTLWALEGAAWWVTQSLAVAAAAGFLVTLRGYDGLEFVGLRQWRARQTRVEDQESFKLSPLHRFVRHPWYFLGLVLVWTREMTTAWLLTAVVVTLYLFVGSRLEERKLARYHGTVYREYQRLVPGIVPRPWRWLGKEEARRLIAKAGHRA
jgi:protein-S-isoprenylcysteine O-methyltransferase Ste14